MEFENSLLAPHMAPDGCYYIRAGAHTERATHFLVDAIYSRQRRKRPIMRHLLRISKNNGDFVELVVATLSPEPALDIEIYFDPIGEVFTGAEHLIPIKVRFIDNSNPFVMSIGAAKRMNERFGESVELKIIYKDIAGKTYEYKHQITAYEGLPLIQPQDYLKDIASAAKKIADKLDKSNL